MAGMSGKAYPRVAVLMGGRSAEREVSLVSGRECAAALRVAGYEAIEVDAGPDLVLFFKHMLVLQGNDAFRLHFNESDALSPSQQGFVEKQFALFNAWYADWSAALAPAYAG